jgi:RNA polymerase sigma-70 factor (ECF subfamily)
MPPAPPSVRPIAGARIFGLATSRPREVPVATEVARLGRSSWFGGLGYSPARMAAEEPLLTREAALERVRARVLGAARRSLSPADAEDLTQDVLVVLSERYGHVSAPAELVALGVRILRFKRAALWRKTARRRQAGATPLPADPDRPDPVETTPDTGAPDPEAIARDRERVRLLAEAAARLDGRCREMLRAKLEGLSFVEIAKQMGRPVNTVYSWDRRCHERLRKLLGSKLGFVSGEESR